MQRCMPREAKMDGMLHSCTGWERLPGNVSRLIIVQGRVHGST
jgi:hypothetical protein